MHHLRGFSRRNRADSVFPDLLPGDSAATDVIRFNRGDPQNIVVPRSAIEPQGPMRITAMSLTNMTQYGDLFVEFMRARRQVFIDRLKWDLPQADGMQFDQYDTPQARWVAVHEYGEVLGGIRLMPTTARCAIYSYMLRDAQLGLLDSIPDDVLFFEAPVEERIWEATRLFIAEGVDAKRRPHVQRMILNAMQAVAADNGATSVIGIVPAVFSRWLKRIGMNAAPVGPKFNIDGTWSQAALFGLTHRMQ